jgi:hypothetical protein
MNTPAFPTWSAKDVVQGMTLRDYFAAAAMQGMLAKHKPDEYQVCAIYAYRTADAMMEVRNVA